MQCTENVANFKLAYQLGSWGERAKAALELLQQYGYRLYEVGSRALFHHENHIEEWINLFTCKNMNIAAVFEIGHFTNVGQQREILFHHSRLARIMKRSGIDFVVLSPGGYKQGSDTGHQAAMDLAERIFERYLKLDISVGIHPHLGGIVFTEESIHRWLERLPETISLVPDTGHLAEAGADPTPFILRYLPRIRHIHLKDGMYKPTVSGRRTQFCPLGSGDLRLGDLLMALSGQFDGIVTIDTETNLRSKSLDAIISTDTAFIQKHVRMLERELG